MRKLFLFLTACLLIATGCKGGTKSPAATADTTPAATETAASVQGGSAGGAFTFEELFGIFSCFGDNIMSEAFAPQGVKDGIKDDLRSTFDSAREFIGAVNWLSYDMPDGDCYNGFHMACYRYKADGHVLTVLLERGGCDVSSVKYIRFYEYDPAQGNAHEVQSPFNPAPQRDDFEDLVRLAGADVPSLRDAMKGGEYNYSFRPEGVTVSLNDPMDFDEQVYHGDLSVDYLWNGSEFVRNEDYRYACIHADGFGNIKLGQGAPNFYFDYDPIGYGVNYSQGGDLWLITLGETDVLQVQMENGKVYSIETRSPKFCVSNTVYDPGRGKVQPAVGRRIGDCIVLSETTPVTMLMDGTIQIVVEAWGSKVAFLTSQDALVNPVQPSMNGPQPLDNPKFKPDARIESILIWRE